MMAPRGNVSECWLRDGIQPLPPLPTDAKLQMLAALAQTGLRRVELTSFAHPRWWPQFSDAEEVVRRYPRARDVEYVALVPNETALSRAVRAQGDERRIDAVTLIVAASEAYNEKNVGKTVGDSLAEIGRCAAMAHKHSMKVVGCVGTAWACPISGKTSPDTAVRLVQRLVDLGADEIMLGDTTGEANPRDAADLVGQVVAQTGQPVIAHFHDARGTAMSNAFAAVAAGATWVDCAFGGVGGHPPEQGVQAADAGNLCTEDFVAALTPNESTGIDVAALLAAGRLAEQLLGRQLNSKVQRAGLPVALGRAARRSSGV